ncbi:MAG: cysteine-rich CWC family protein [Gammaproteobacteria bacterium]|nr:cysteine-rich CWC family protein [Gammaproteobacteria bacterium]
MRCERCGANFHCGMDDTAPCWCATDFPPVISGTAGSSCLCPSCLEQLVSATQAKP